MVCNMVCDMGGLLGRGRMAPDATLKPGLYPCQYSRLCLMPHRPLVVNRDGACEPVQKWGHTLSKQWRWPVQQSGSLVYRRRKSWPISC